MQLYQLITIVGLALSHVQANIPAIVGNQDEMIQKVVTLITDPSSVVETIPGLKELASEAKSSAPLSHAQMHQGAREVLTSLRDVDNKHAPLVFESLVGYHSTHDPKRAEIYRDSMYSRISDLSKAYPDQFEEHIQTAYNRLLSSFRLQIMNMQASHLHPMGTKVALEKFDKFIAQLKSKNQKQLNRFYNALLDSIPPRPVSKMTYLSREDVNKALLETNSNPELPRALLVDGKYLRSLSKHAHAPGKVPVTPAHQTSPVVA